MSLIRELQELYTEGGLRRIGVGIFDHAWWNVFRPTIRATIPGPSIFLHSKLRHRLNVFNDDWDMLVLLDCCRPDALESVRNEYDFISDIDSQWSAGAASAEWMINTFDQDFADEISNTAYLTSNPNAAEIFMNEMQNGSWNTQQSNQRLIRYTDSAPVSSGDFFQFEYISDIVENIGPSPYPSPRSLTDLAIKTDRNESPPRLVVHYMPPHKPFIAVNNDGSIKLADEPLPSTYENYLNNLRWILNEIDLLLQNVNRDRVVISADHGYRFSKYKRGHMNGIVSPTVRRVPWVVTTGKDTGSHEPSISSTRNENNDPEVEDMLEALGYL